MNTLLAIVIVVQVVTALVIIGLVLLQHGKGADMGAAFGSGASGSLFGASGSSNFLSRSTGIAAAVFFAATLALSFLGSRPIAAGGAGVMDQIPATPATPAKPQNPAGQPQPSAPASGQSGEIPK
ncbi:MAG: preprotein translocase subunit SecG [Oxalobacteraceae bacterium]|jgi:preprotein translocase subunit SecG|nr:preprotein translocase subunit SecG [Oxalobacteraceae bacterium]